LQSEFGGNRIQIIDPVGQYDYLFEPGPLVMLELPGFGEESFSPLFLPIL
jgi:hypothetical protein